MALIWQPKLCFFNDWTKKLEKMDVKVGQFYTKKWQNSYVKAFEVPKTPSIKLKLIKLYLFSTVIMTYFDFMGGLFWVRNKKE